MLENYCVDCDKCRNVNNFSHIVVEPPQELFQQGLSSTEILKRWLRNSDDLTEAGSPSSAGEVFADILLDSLSRRSLRLRRASSVGVQVEPLSPFRVNIQEELASIERLTAMRAIARRDNKPRCLAQEQMENSHAMASLVTACGEAVENGVELDPGTPESEAEQILHEIGQVAFECARFKFTGGQRGKLHEPDEISSLMSRLEMASGEQIARIDAAKPGRDSARKDASGTCRVNNAEQHLQEKRTRSVQRRSAFAKFKCAASKRTSTLQPFWKHPRSSVREVSMVGPHQRNPGPAELEASDTQRHTPYSDNTHLIESGIPKRDLSAWEKGLLDGNLTDQEMGALDKYYDMAIPLEMYPSADGQSAYFRRVSQTDQGEQILPLNFDSADSHDSVFHHQYLSIPDDKFSDKETIERPLRIRKIPSNTFHAVEGHSPASNYSRSEIESFMAQPKPHDQNLSMFDRPAFTPRYKAKANLSVNTSGEPTIERSQYSGVPPFVINENIPFLQSPTSGTDDEMVFTSDYESMSRRDNFMYMLKTSFDTKLAQKEKQIAMLQQIIKKQAGKIASQERKINELRAVIAGLRKEQQQQKRRLANEDTSSVRTDSNISNRGGQTRFPERTSSLAYAFAAPPIRTMSASPTRGISSFKKDATARYSPSKIGNNMMLEGTTFEGMDEYERLRDESTIAMWKERRGLLSPGIFDSDESIELDCGTNT